MQLDHVLIAVRDLEAGSRTLESKHGLPSSAGGEHRAWGTANRIVPLGDAYLELISVVDRRRAATNAFGRWVDRDSSADGSLLGWAVRTDDLEGVSERLGLEISAGSRVRRDGTVLEWRLAGVDEVPEEPSLPFFIEWASGSAFPGCADAVGRIVGLDVSGDPDRISEWLGKKDLPITIRPGRAAVERVRVVTTAGRPVEIGSGQALASGGARS